MVYIVPWCSSIVAFFKSGIILIMTILGIFIPYARAILQMDDVLNADIQTISIIGPPHVISLVLAGGIAFYTFRRSLDEIADIKEHFI